MHRSLIVIALLAAGCKKPPAAATDEEPVVLHIAAINDYHGALYERLDKEEEGKAYGGLPWLVSAVDTLRAEHDDLLLLDGGDLFQGAWPVNASLGLGSIESFELLDVDAAAIGNHEFDYGPGHEADTHPTRGALREAAAVAPFDWLSANIYDGDDRWQPEGVAPWTIVERGGVRVGVIGLTTRDTPQTTLLANVEDLQFRDVVETVEAILPTFDEQDVDVVAVVGHLTGACEPTSYAEAGEPCLPSGEIGELLTELPPGTIDLMVVGHAHTLMHHRYEDTIVLENRAYGHMVGQVDLVVGPDGPDLDASVIHDPWVLHHDAVEPGCSGEPFPTAPLEVGGRTLSPSAEALSLIERLEDESGSLCDPIGCSDVVVGRERQGESAAGNAMADAMLAAFPEADLAIANSGGIRADYPQGEIRVEHVHSVMPFDNRVLLVELTGEQVELLFQIGSSGAHGILQVAGGAYHFDPEASDGSDIDGDGEVETWETDRLCSVTVADQSPDPQETYTVVTTDFLYGGGDHLGPALSEAPILEEGALLRDEIVTWFRARDSCLGHKGPLIDPDARRITTASCPNPG